MGSNRQPLSWVRRDPSQSPPDTVCSACLSPSSRCRRQTIARSESKRRHALPFQFGMQSPRDFRREAIFRRPSSQPVQARSGLGTQIPGPLTADKEQVRLGARRLDEPARRRPSLKKLLRQLTACNLRQNSSVAGNCDAVQPRQPVVRQMAKKEGQVGAQLKLTQAVGPPPSRSWPSPEEGRLPGPRFHGNQRHSHSRRDRRPHRNDVADLTLILRGPTLTAAIGWF